MSNTFIVSSHQADRAGLHQDLYLSSSADCTNYMAWALPKGIPLKSGDRRLAVRVEDHSPQQAEFEGVIAEGYGKGTKELFDEGTFIAYKHITAPKPIKLEFYGSKVRGTYFLKHWEDKRWLIWKAS